MGFLRYDSDFMVMLGRIADYVILNVLCVIFSIPLFTVGAAVTAKLCGNEAGTKGRAECF